MNQQIDRGLSKIRCPYCCLAFNMLECRLIAGYTKTEMKQLVIDRLLVNSKIAIQENMKAKVKLKVQIENEFTISIMMHINSTALDIKTLIYGKYLRNCIPEEMVLIYHEKVMKDRHNILQTVCLYQKDVIFQYRRAEIGELEEP